MGKAIRTIGIGVAGLLVIAGCSLFGSNQSASSGASSYGSASTSASYSRGTKNQTASSESVRQAQQELKSAGFDPGQIDGRMGPETQKALKDFQQSKGIRVTGQLDDQTQQGLARAGNSSGSPAAGTSNSNDQNSQNTINQNKQ